MSRCITQMSLRLVTLGSSRWDVVWWVGFWDVGVCVYKWWRYETWGSMSFFGTMYTAWIYRHLMQPTFQKLQGWVFLTEVRHVIFISKVLYMATQKHLPHIGEGFGGHFWAWRKPSPRSYNERPKSSSQDTAEQKISRKALCIGIYRHTCMSMYKWCEYIH